jgi:hypothetical protein
MDRSAFLQMNPLALLASEGVIYATYRLGPIEVGGRMLEVLATFAREKLWMVELVDANLDGQELSEPMKARAKARNDEWLTDILGGAGPRFPWGSVQARSDRKDGVPGIVVRYF